MPCYLNVRAAFPLIFTLCLCQCQSPIRTPDSSRALVLIATNDPTGSFDGFEGTMRNSLASSPTYRATFARISDLYQFRAALLDEATKNGPIHTLILAFHGRPNKLQLNAEESLHQRNVQEVCQGLDRALHPAANVILFSCLTGEGDDNLAQDLARALKRPVQAPTHFWLMQTAVPLAQRIPELNCDPQGRLRIDTSQFALFYKARMDSGKDRHLIAPLAMEALCLADGFLKRPSRFRPLFHCYSP